jgi:monoamine oxidase
VKIMFRFAERFWDDNDFLRRRSGGKSGNAEPLNFVHSSDRFVPTWWTGAPLRSPILTGWAGGHAADALLAEGKEALADRALDSLAAACRMRRRTLDPLLRATWTHDWQSDPFSRGAYSYAGIGGTGAHDALARPVCRTLFFAREATDAKQTGTVAGAIESGRRAARQVVGRSASVGATKILSNSAARSGRPK